jgi:hypothetical protein
MTYRLGILQASQTAVFETARPAGALTMWAIAAIA